MWARGTRSPLAPTEPCWGMTGVTPASSRESRDSMICGRTPEYPLASVFARRSIMARQTSVENSSPTPAL